jgi:sterol desaturase/sphingolipid hydroxylase (fatty acid hydroxylase superfamily)
LDIAIAESQLAAWLMALAPLEAVGWLLLQNLAQLLMCIGGGWLLQRALPQRRVAPIADPLTRQELAVGGMTLLGNTAVTWLGWRALTLGWIRLDLSGSVWQILWDTAVLLLAMDLAMYLAHRVAHVPSLFAAVHGLHHRYERVRPLTLFVLSPLEVFGFGGLWLVTLAVLQPSWSAMILYLLINALWGTMGHTGIEPLPNGVALLTGGRFHSDHHLDPRGNFGFYTDLWDRLGRTRLADARGSVGPLDAT